MFLSAHEPVYEVAAADAAAVIRQALDRSSDSRPLSPEDDRAVKSALKRLWRIGSWKALMSPGVRAVEVDRNPAGVLSLQPTRNLGKVEGFEPLMERAIALRDDASDVELGAAVREALSRSE